MFVTDCQQEQQQLLCHLPLRYLELLKVPQAMYNENKWIQRRLNNYKKEPQNENYFNVRFNTFNTISTFSISIMKTWEPKRKFQEKKQSEWVNEYTQLTIKKASMGYTEYKREENLEIVRIERW